jgi:hypothetical protein
MSIYIGNELTIAKFTESLTSEGKPLGAKVFKKMEKQ